MTKAALCLLLLLCSCGERYDLQTGPYKGVVLDFALSAKHLAPETIERVEAALGFSVEVHYSDWQTFDDIGLEQYEDYSTVYIGIRPEDYLIDYDDGTRGPFLGCYHWFGASLAAINYANAESLTTTIIHEIAHSCGWTHEDADMFGFIRGCFYE